MDREGWHAVVHGVAKSWTQLSNRTELKTTKMMLIRPLMTNLKMTVLFLHYYYSVLFPYHFVLKLSPPACHGG